jgi:hypothetical protein
VPTEPVLTKLTALGLHCYLVLATHLGEGISRLSATTYMSDEGFFDESDVEVCDAYLYGILIKSHRQASMGLTRMKMIVHRLQ